MYQRIMVAIDSNFASGKVLDTGIEMARRFGAQLALCHALDDTILAQQFARVAKRDALPSESAGAVALRIVPPRQASATMRGRGPYGGGSAA